MKSASMLRRYSAFCIVHFAVLCAAGASQLAVGNARFTLLAPRMVRCEWSADGAFDETNLFVNGVAVLAEDKENLLGTPRTLDRKCALSDTLATMEKGLLSRRGVTVVDDAATPLSTENGWVAERPPREKGAYRAYDAAGIHRASAQGCRKVMEC